MTKQVYWTTAILSILLLVLTLLLRKNMSQGTLIWSTSILFFVIVASIHGVIAHSLTIPQKGGLIFYPILMGVLFAILAYLYLFLILPIIVNT